MYDVAQRGSFIGIECNYRNWSHPTLTEKSNEAKDILALKTFSCLCWMQSKYDYQICSADHEQQIHIISILNNRCIALLKNPRKDANYIQLIAHPILKNVLIAIDDGYECQFWDVRKECIIAVLEDNITRIVC